MPKKSQPRNRGSITQRGDGKYLVRVYLGTDGQGKRIYSSKTVRGSRADAERMKTQMLREVDTNSYAGPTNTTLTEFLDVWLNMKEGSVSARTHADYRTRMEKDILPEVGHLKLEKLTSPMLQKVFDKLKGLRSPRTLQYNRMILRQMLDQAVAWDLIPKNPAANLVIPKQTRKEMSTLTPLQAKQLIQTAVEKQPQFVALWVLLLTTGLRPSEALGLKWGDLQQDEDGQPFLSLVRSLVRVSTGKYEVGDLKTDQSRRRVSLDPYTLDFLQRHRRRQAAAALQAGPGYDRQDWIFANTLGHFWDLSKVRKAWKRALKNCGAPKDIRLYDTRHTHASLLLSRGVHPKTVAGRLGHSSTNLTLNTYSHVLEQVAKEAAGKGAAAIFDAVEKPA